MKINQAYHFKRKMDNSIPHNKVFQKVHIDFHMGFHMGVLSFYLKIQGSQEDKDMCVSEFTTVWDWICSIQWAYCVGLSNFK